MSRLEKAEEKEIQLWCKSKDVLFIKFTPKGERGWCDRIAIFPGGLHIWVELKRKGEKPRDLQLHRMRQLVDQGAVVTWFDNAKDCIEYFTDCLETALKVINGTDT